MAEPSGETVSDSPIYQDEITLMHRFNLRRIANLELTLPSRFSTPEGLDIVVEGGRTDQGTTIEMTERLVRETPDATRYSRVIIERETRRPEIACLKVDRYVEDDTSATHGLGTVYEHFGLDDASSTMALGEVRGIVKRASHTVWAAELAQVQAELDEVPLVSLFARMCAMR